MQFDRRTLGLCLRCNAREIPDQLAIEYAPSVSSYWSCTWKELDEVTDLLAIRFEREWGITFGTHAAIWSLNNPAFVQTYLALAKAGAVTSVINTAYRVEEMADVLICMEQMKEIYGISDFELQKIIDRKVKRQEARLDESERRLFEKQPVYRLWCGY